MYKRGTSQSSFSDNSIPHRSRDIGLRFSSKYGMVLDFTYNPVKISSQPNESNSLDNVKPCKCIRMYIDNVSARHSKAGYKLSVCSQCTDRSNRRFS